MGAASRGFALVYGISGRLCRAVKKILVGPEPPYPVPDRPNIKRNFKKTPENDQIDLGWQEGVLSDGRPYRGEFWTWDDVSSLTFFMSARGLESASNQELGELLEREGLLKFKSPDGRYVAAKRIVDASGNDLWSINVVLCDSDGSFLEPKGGFPFHSYRAPG